ncbi:MAG: MGMT family protein [Candidatus Lloydbacteria bacterium]|nr:MGMT family protein [Candidatus Lloydbacteria bacterium]
MTSFKQKVFAIVKKIPAGKTLSYGEVAKRTGNKKAARAVGAVLKTNYDPAIPCHRVIRSDGALGGYNRSIARKNNLLIKEGYKSSPTKHI